MLRSAIVAAAVLLATEAVAAPVSIPLSASYVQTFGGFGSDGTEALFDLDIPPLDTSAGSDLITISFSGTVSQSLSFLFEGNEFGDSSYCGATWALPGFSIFVAGETLAAAEVDTGVAVCGDIGETVGDIESAPVSLSAAIDASNPLFASLFEGFPLQFVFRDPNWWDLERNFFDSHVYITGFEGTLTIEATAITPGEVPEPRALGLLGLGLLALGVGRRRASAG